MDVRLLFPTLYLGSPDLRGQDFTLTITTLAVEGLKTNRGTEQKPVLYFEETRASAVKRNERDKEKRLVLNKTNATFIAEMYGYEADQWPGKRITLYPTTCEAFGETVDCIRVRPGKPPAKEKPPTQHVQLEAASAEVTAPGLEPSQPLDF